MGVHLPKRTAKAEAIDARNRHLSILQDVEKWCVQSNAGKEGFFYLSAIPIIYSAWEGYFRITCAICLRRLCMRGTPVKKYDGKYATLWLQKEGFLEAFLRALINSMTLGKDNRKINAGRFNALTSFTDSINNWFESPLNHSSNFDELVMTYSNVNADVARLNGNIIGLNLSGVDFSKLDEMLGRRNDISHGGLISYPQESVVTGLLVYTINLINQFGAAVDTWLEST